MLSMTAAAYYVFNDLADYYNYEVVTTIKTEYDQPRQFPTVSFCSYEPHLYDINFQIKKKTSIFSNDESVSVDPDNHYESFFTLLYGKFFRFNSGKNLKNHRIPIKNST